MSRSYVLLGLGKLGCGGFAVGWGGISADGGLNLGSASREYSALLWSNAGQLPGSSDLVALPRDS